VTDLATPADGFDFAVADVLAEVEGTWEGSADLQGGGPAVVDLGVAWDGGLVEAVLSHLEDDGQDGTFGVGAPAGDCSPVYELGLALDLAASPYLDAGGGARVAADGHRLDVAVQVDAGDVGGTLEPPAWDHPEFWDRTALSMVFAASDGAATLGLDWWAINDDPLQTTGTATTPGGGTVHTGVVEPSGQNSPIAWIGDLVRQ
jgi:hypothetical protein